MYVAIKYSDADVRYSSAFLSQGIKYCYFDHWYDKDMHNVICAFRLVDLELLQYWMKSGNIFVFFSRWYLKQTEQEAQHTGILLFLWATQADNGILYAMLMLAATLAQDIP